jgi:diguanylate cyclase (GGDEF)-like protein
MQHRLSAFLLARSRLQIATISLLLIVLVGVIDYASGYELSFSIFYLIPVAVGSWYAGRRIGILASVLSASVWFMADYASGHRYSTFEIPIWNAIVRLGFFFIVAILLARLRALVEMQTSLALQDGLTGILNGRAFNERYELLVKLAARQRRPIALGYLDVDGFKGINDTLGHSAGDQVLRAVAKTITGRLRASDFAGRLGGDEFAILLQDVGLEGAKTLFADIHGALLDIARRNRWPIGFSIGVVVFHSPPASADKAIGSADALMYKIKKAGKNELAFEEAGVDAKGS